MGMNSCLYETNIMHCRIRPKRHKFTHKVFMFYLDLDEIDTLTQKVPLISRNKSNIYSFRDDDHLALDGKDIKTKVLEFLKSKGVELEGGRIMLLTNLRTFGHIFNPVSFYFCFDSSGDPVCVVPEICNTFREIKPFFMGKESFKAGQFVSQQKKYFYISPFIALDVPMDFQLRVPGEELRIRIDDFDEGGKFLYATMAGTRQELTSANLWWYTLKFPFITLKVIGLIHVHAFLLWLKKIPHHEKDSNMHLQKGVYRAWNKSKKAKERLEHPAEV